MCFFYIIIIALLSVQCNRTKICDVNFTAVGSCGDICRQRCHPASAVRLPTKNFGCEDTLKTVPLYAAYCL